MTQSVSEVCRTCNLPHGGQNGYAPMHPFNDGSVAPSQTFGKRQPGQPAGAARVAQPAVEVAEAAWPFDPVLRQALMNKGVIAPSDLREAEDQIRAVTAQFLRGDLSDNANPVT